MTAAGVTYFVGVAFWNLVGAGLFGLFHCLFNPLVLSHELRSLDRCTNVRRRLPSVRQTAADSR